MPRPKSPKTRCTGPDCDRWAYATGLCKTHYRQQARGKTLAPIVEKTGNPLVTVSLRVPPKVAETVKRHGAEAKGVLVAWAAGKKTTKPAKL